MTIFAWANVLNSR